MSSSSGSGPLSVAVTVGLFAAATLSLFAFGQMRGDDAAPLGARNGAHRPPIADTTATRSATDLSLAAPAPQPADPLIASVRATLDALDQPMPNAAPNLAPNLALTPPRSTDAKTMIAALAPPASADAPPVAWADPVAAPPPVAGSGPAASPQRVPDPHAHAETPPHEDHAAPLPARVAPAASSIPCVAELQTIAARTTIYFDTNSAALDLRSREAAYFVAAQIAACPQASITILGFTDPIGDPEANLALSWRRANNVRKAIAEAGFDTAQVAAQSHMQDHPENCVHFDVVDRRVEFVVSDRAAPEH